MTTLYIKAFPLEVYDPGSGIHYAYINYTATQLINQPTAQAVVQFGTVQNTSATPYPIFVAGDYSGAITFLGAATSATLIAQVNSDAGATLFTTYDLEQIDAPVGAALISKTNKSGFAALTSLAAHGVANASAASNPGLATNYNLVSGVLGIANGLNDANTAQNDLATKYNDMEAKFNSILTWLGTNKDKINSAITAGAA